MTTVVDFLPDRAIEKDPEALLASYAPARKAAIEPPIPIDDIIEKHLKIGIEFDDTHRLFGVPRSDYGHDPDILVDRRKHRDRRRPRSRLQSGQGRALPAHGGA